MTAYSATAFSRTHLIARTGNDSYCRWQRRQHTGCRHRHPHMYGGPAPPLSYFAPATRRSTIRTAWTIIGDFKPGTDKLDFSAFNRLATHSTSSAPRRYTAPGQVRLSHSGGFTFVEGDVTSRRCRRLRNPAGRQSRPASHRLHFGSACYTVGTFIMTDRARSRSRI